MIRADKELHKSNRPYFRRRKRAIPFANFRRTIVICLIVNFFFFVYSSARADIYRFVDDNGQEHYVDQPEKVPVQYLEQIADGPIIISQHPAGTRNQKEKIKDPKSKKSKTKKPSQIKSKEKVPIKKVNKKKGKRKGSGD